MLSVKKCKRILEDNGKKKYSDEEVTRIRKELYNLAQIITDTKTIDNDKMGK